MTTKQLSERARQFWSRLLSWYGARLGDQYGAKPPEDWASAIDKHPRDVIERALTEIRVNHPTFPPTFPEFDAIVSRCSRSANAGPSRQIKLHDFVVKHRKLTHAQLAGHWAYCYVEGICVAVDVPADGDVPGFRVRLDDVPADA